LVTGAAGFIGSHVADRCLKLGIEVVGTGDLSGDFSANVAEAVNFRHGDVSHRRCVASLFEGPL
jgi:UDP-glucose 4-epimerase